MSQPFDPYLHWLGIREPQRPPNHYRLLGIDLFEADSDVIAGAADRQMAHVRGFQTGQHAELSQKILNELAAARVCLLKPDRKAAYDAELRKRVAAMTPPPKPTAVIQASAAAVGTTAVTSVEAKPVAQPGAAATTVAEYPSFDDIASSTRRRSPIAKKKKSSTSLPIVGGLLALIMVTALVVWNTRSDHRETARVDKGPSRNRSGQSSLAVSGRKKDTFPFSEDGSGIGARPKPGEPDTSPSNHSPATKPSSPDDAIAPVVAPTASETSEEIQPETSESPAAEPDESGDEAGEDAPTEEATTEPNSYAAQELTFPEGTSIADELPSLDPLKPTDNRLAVPDEAVQKAALQRIREIFGKDIEAAKAPDAKAQLAKTLLAQTKETKDDEPVEFALLELAEDAAIAAGEIGLAREVIDRRAARFNVSAITQKSDALFQVNRQAKSAAIREALPPIAAELIVAALAENNFKLALKLNQFCQQAATKSRNRDAIKATIARDKSIKESQKLYESAAAAVEILKTKEDDLEANFQLGAYLCFVRHDWEHGLLRLSKGSNPAIQDAAMQELTRPTEPGAQKHLADLWLKCAEAKELASWTSGMRGRALKWYELALDGLAGLDKAQVEKRIEELSDETGEFNGLTKEGRAGQQITVKLPAGAAMTFRRIPAGKFIMGSPVFEPLRRVDETQRTVTITKPFYLGQTEVTQAQWKAVMNTNPALHQGDLQLPIENVNWEQANAYCQMLTKAFAARKYKFRLPTEAEWEYACRAGTTTMFGFGNDLTRLTEYAWVGRNSRNETHPVGQLTPNAWGLYDMHGNIAEMCQDWLAPYDPKATADPVYATPALSRVNRGGTTFATEENLHLIRSASRGGNPPGEVRGYLGFRVALESP